MSIDELNEFMHDHGFCNTNNNEDLPKKYVADLVESALRVGYNQGTIDRAEEVTKAREHGYAKGIDDFYDNVLNFEDYIEPIDTSEFGAVLLYSGNDITNMIVKIKEEMRGAE